MRLFVERAQAHQPDFALNEREAPAVAELVARLEGIPLALELAAARVRALSVAEINARLNDRYQLLTGGSRVLQERQQTLRALVDWSLRPARTRASSACCGRLAVFVGGFDLEAAEQVCAAPSRWTAEVLDLLASLVEKSLVHARRARATARAIACWRRSATTRAKSSSSRPTTPATAARHCEHYFALAKEARNGLAGRSRRAGLDALEAELDNLRAAIVAGAGRRRRPAHRGQAGGGAAGFLDPARLRHRGPRLVQAALAPAGHPGLGPGACACAVRRRGTGREPGRPRRGAQMLESAWRCVAAGESGDIAATLSTLSSGAAAGGRPAGAARRTRGACALPRARRPRRRGHRPAAPGPDRAPHR